MAKKARSEKQKANDARLAAMGKAKRVTGPGIQIIRFQTKKGMKKITVKRRNEAVTTTGAYNMNAPSAVRGLTTTGLAGVCRDYCKKNEPKFK